MPRAVYRDFVSRRPGRRRLPGGAWYASPIAPTSCLMPLISPSRLAWSPTRTEALVDGQTRYAASGKCKCIPKGFSRSMRAVFTTARTVAVGRYRPTFPRPRRPVPRASMKQAGHKPGMGNAEQAQLRLAHIDHADDRVIVFRSGQDRFGRSHRVRRRSVPCCWLEDVPR